MDKKYIIGIGALLGVVKAKRNPTRPVKAPPMGRSKGELYKIGVTDLKYLGTDFINNGKNEARIFRGYWMGDLYQYAVYRQKGIDRIYTKRKSI